LFLCYLVEEGISQNAGVIHNAIEAPEGALRCFHNAPSAIGIGDAI